MSNNKNFVWTEYKIEEARNATGGLLAQYFSGGQTIGGTNYFETKDHLGSIREMTDSSGNIQAEYSYDSYGRVTKVQGGLASDFQYAGYYYHSPSGLNFPMHRAYSPTLGRWINRDPIEEDGGINLYDFVNNNPINYTDMFGYKVVSDGTDGLPKGSVYQCKDGVRTVTYHGHDVSGMVIACSESICSPDPQSKLQKQQQNFKKACDEEHPQCDTKKKKKN